MKTETAKTDNGLYSHYLKGKQDFNKLSRTEQVIRQGAENGVQNFSGKHLEWHRPAPKGNLGIFLKATVSLKNTLHKVLERMHKK